MHVAQINIAERIAPLDSPVMADFMANLDPINNLAELAPGFVWRLKDESGDSTSIKIFDNDFLVINMSVWETVDDLFNFAYKSDHVKIFQRRGEWFSKMPAMHLALWFIEEGTEPTVKEAEKRLEHIRAHGPSPFAFTFKKRFSISDLKNE